MGGGFTIQSEVKGINKIKSDTVFSYENLAAVSENKHIHFPQNFNKSHLIRGEMQVELINFENLKSLLKRYKQILKKETLSLKAKLLTRLSKGNKNGQDLKQMF